MAHRDRVAGAIEAARIERRIGAIVRPVFASVAVALPIVAIAAVAGLADVDPAAPLGTQALVGGAILALGAWLVARSDRRGALAPAVPAVGGVTHAVGGSIATATVAVIAAAGGATASAALASRRASGAGRLTAAGPLALSALIIAAVIAATAGRAHHDLFPRAVGHLCAGVVVAASAARFVVPRAVTLRLVVGVHGALVIWAGSLKALHYKHMLPDPAPGIVLVLLGAIAVINVVHHPLARAFAAVVCISAALLPAYFDHLIWGSNPALALSNLPGVALSVSVVLFAGAAMLDLVGYLHAALSRRFGVRSRQPFARAAD
jgi:hypothetical protein